MKPAWKAAWGAAALAVVLAGCGAKRERKAVAAAIPALAATGARPAGGAEATAERFCRGLHAAAASQRAECCGAPAQAAPQQADCVALLSDAIARGAVALDEAAVDACLAARAASVEGCDWVTPGSAPAPASCRGVVQGKVALAGKCRSSVECEAGLSCDAGQCRAPAPRGRSCATGVDALAVATGQYDAERAHPACAEHCDAVTHKCVAIPAEGAICFTSAGCAAGSVCDGGRCRVGALKAAGEACDRVACAEGLVCKAGTCRAKAKPGEACASDLECASGGCRSATPGAPTTCGMTCSHAGDLDRIKAVLSQRGERPALAGKGQ